MNVKELRDLAVSALVLALAFGIALSGGFRAFQRPGVLAFVIVPALIAVSLGFIFHEMGHRLIARRFGYFAEYAMWPAGLAIALGFSLFGFVFAAPGAVMIQPKTAWGPGSTREIGLISLAGPATNIGLALVFLALESIDPALLFALGARINAWLAIFNLIPFGPLDGAKILRWNAGVWVLSIAVAGGLFAAQRFLF
ncbi:MAG: site-2 protease family protein [Chloroflexi bacterium]|nr:site-2 protease family protein [Chloroflexota bacterium]